MDIFIILIDVIVLAPSAVGEYVAGIEVDAPDIGLPGHIFRCVEGAFAKADQDLRVRSLTLLDSKLNVTMSLVFLLSD